MRALALAAVLVAGSLALADEPMPKPATSTVRSANGKFCSVSEPSDKTTTVYKLDEKGEKTHYHWGGFRGLDEKGRFVVETVEGKEVVIEVPSGKVLEKREAKKK